MASDDRRARARRRAWGRGPAILRFEPLEGRELLSATDALSSIASIAAAAVSTAGTPTATAAASTADTATTTATTTTTPASTTTTSSSTDSSTLPAQPTVAFTTPVVAPNPAPTQSGVTITASGTSSASTATTATTTTPTYDGSNLVVSSFSTPHNLDWGDAFHATGTVSNLGSMPTPAAYDVNVYASAESTVDADSLLLGTITVPAGVAAGATSNFDQVLNAPLVPLTNLGSATTYTIIPVLSAEGATAGTTPLAAAGLPQDSLVTVTPKIAPDLQGAGLSITPGSVTWGSTISVTASVLNNSQGAAPPTNARIVLTPAGQAPGGADDYQIGQVPIPPIAAMQTVTATQNITLPNFPPTVLASGSNYTVTMIQDADAAASPLLPPVPSTTTADTTTLTIAASATPPVPASQAPLPADLTVTNVQEPTALFRGGTFTVGATVQNSGPGAAGPFKVRFLLLTDESASAPALVLGDASLPGLAAGTQQDVLQTVTLPYTTPAGFTADSPTARIVAEVDPDRAINESNTANESLAAADVPLQVLTPDGQTTVPVLPGGTVTPTTNGSTTTTPPTAAGNASGFTTVTIAANAVPTATTSAPSVTTTSTTTTATTTTSATTATVPSTPATRAAARHAALAAKQAEAAARRSAAAESHAQALLHRAQLRAARPHALRVFRPTAK